MSPLREIDINLEGIGHVLSDSILAVPVYQRSYAWEARHVTDLFQDIADAINRNEPEYFLGSIVIIENTSGSYPEVVDGQQRLATTTILLAAIRDHFHKEGDVQRSADIERKYLISRNIRSQEEVSQFRLNESDHDFFVKRILLPPDSAERQAIDKSSTTSPTQESHKRLVRAAELAGDHVKRLTELTNRPANLLIDWIEYLTDNARIIKVLVPDRANAFTIFETLNDRGLNLAISDLLKNYLFGLADNRISEVQERWVRMMGTLETVDDEDVIVDYIRHLWSSKYGATREKDLYDKIKRRINSKQAAIDLSSELAEDSRLYAALLNTNQGLWSIYGTTARDHIGTINLLRMVQIRPLLLAILKKFEPSEVRKSLRVMVSWGVRFLISGGLGGGTLERHYSERAIEVREGLIANARDLVKAMQDVVPSDARFQTAFATASVARNYFARYYLRVLENQAREQAEPERVPNPNEEIVNLEHVLPQNPAEKGFEIDHETHKTYYRRIGNLALMKVSSNLEGGNETFDSKRKLYSDSDFILTSRISKYEKWGITEIEERQQELARLAVAAWRTEA